MKYEKSKFIDPMRIFIVITILAVTIACEDRNKNPEDEVDYQTICKEFDDLAFEQKDILNQIREKYKHDKEFIARFNEEQISWIGFQDRRLRSLYPKDWDRFYRKNYGKPVFNACKCEELIRMSKIRNEDLRIYLDGPVSDQKNCPVQGNR